MENKWKNKDFISALKNALNGIMYVFKNERNFRIQLFIAIIVITFCLLIKLELYKIAIIILTILFVWFAEFINTAFEIVIDMYTVEYNEKAKIAKDIAAGAVTIVSLFSVIIGAIIFLPILI